MEAYYQNQATMPHFPGHYRQRVSGFDALALGIGRVALPLARKLIVPAAKRIEKALLVQAAPELKDIATKKKTPTQALKNTVKNTIKNNLELNASGPVCAENGRQQKQQQQKKSSQSKGSNSTEKWLQLFHQSTK